MDIQQILKESRLIWGGEKLELCQIIVRMGKVFGDICRWERNELPTDRKSADELKKELGNMIVSSVRWCDDLGYDSEECICLALKAQKEYNLKRKTHKNLR